MSTLEQPCRAKPAHLDASTMSRSPGSPPASPGPAGLATRIREVLQLHREHARLERALYELQRRAWIGDPTVTTQAEPLWTRHDRLEREIVAAWAELPTPVIDRLRDGETDEAALIAAARSEVAPAQAA